MNRWTVHTFSDRKCYNRITAGFCCFFCLFHNTGGKSSALHVYKAKGYPWLLSPGACSIPRDLAPGKCPESCLGMDVPFSSYPAVDVKLLGMVILFFLYSIIYGGLSEEPGWRGFALPRLQAKFSPLVSSLILGVFWAVWHAPARFGGIEAKSLSDTLVEWVLIVLVTVIFTWFFNRTKGSILVTALVHPAMNTATSFLTGSLGALILLFVFMLFVIVLDRMWRRLPADNPAIYRMRTQEVA